jgi:hypothetical protein
LGQGRDAVKQLFADNPELAEEIETKIRLATQLTISAEPESSNS